MTRFLDIDGLSVADGTGATITHPMGLHIERGETIGIVGESGSGKSLTAKAIAGLLPPGLTASGSVLLEGEKILGAPESRMAKLRGNRISLLFQNPFTMLNPLQRAGEHVAEGLHLHGPARPRRERGAEVARRLREVGIDDPGIGRRYPFELSGGLRQRVGIAAALSGDPDLLIADEPSTALDVTTQAEVIALLQRLQAQRGLSLMLITHDLRLAFSVCDRVYVFYAGTLLEVGPSDAIARAPAHPYTHGLLLSEPPVDTRMARLRAIPGAVPRPAEVAGACAFSTRCRWAAPACRAGVPPLVPVGAGRSVACIRLDGIAGEMAEERGSFRQAAMAARPEAPAEPPVLHVENLSKSFGPSGARVQALKGVSLTLHRGRTLALVGESGSGKSTIGRCILGLETPDSGAIAVGGLDAVTPTEADRRALCRIVQVVFQDPYSTLNPRHSIGFTLSETLRAVGIRDDRAGRIAALLEQVQLPADYAARRPAQLSGGERQRVAIARALAVSPDLIVCDEPVSALDVSVQALVLNLLNDVQRERGIAYLFITHDLAVARQVADAVCVLHRGEIVERGEADRVLSHPRAAYTRKLISAVPH